MFVNQHYNFPTEFLGDKVGQFVQAHLQLGPRSCLETNRLKINLVPPLKRLYKTIFPILVEAGNRVLKVRKHFLQRFASEILSRVEVV